MTRSLRWQALLLLVAIVLPLLGGLRAPAAEPTHPCGAAMPADPGPQDAAPAPCGAALKLPCCDQTATLSKTDESVVDAFAPALVALFPWPAPHATPALHPPDVRGSARAAPQLPAILASTILRI